LNAEVRIPSPKHMNFTMGWNNRNASESAARQVEAYNGADTEPIHIITTTLLTVALLVVGSS
jgi:hypothetical protein